MAKEERFREAGQVWVEGTVSSDVHIDCRAEIDRLRINLRDYRAKHPCGHEIMCWADEIASKALAKHME
jgi:hypothetical protein